MKGKDDWALEQYLSAHANTQCKSFSFCSLNHWSWCRGTVVCPLPPPHTYTHTQRSCWHSSGSKKDWFAMKILEIYKAKLLPPLYWWTINTQLDLHTDWVYQQLRSFKITRYRITNFATQVIRAEFLLCGHEIPFRWHKKDNLWRGGWNDSHILLKQRLTTPCHKGLAESKVVHSLLQKTRCWSLPRTPKSLKLLEKLSWKQLFHGKLSFSASGVPSFKQRSLFVMWRTLHYSTFQL